MALVRKILETTIASGGTTATFTDSDIPNSLIRVYATDSNIYPQTVSLTGTTLTVTYEAVSSSLGVAVEIVKQGLTINDTLTSTATDEALSANQGKALKDIIDNLGVPALTELSDVDFVSLADGDTIVYDSINEKFVNQSMPSIPSNITDLNDVVITSPVNGQVLTYYNGDIINSTATGGVSYSETEQNTGIKWYDNKDIYLKVFTGTISSSPTTIGVTTSLGIDTIIKAEGFVVSSNGYKMLVPSYVNSTNATGIYTDASGNIRLYNLGSYNNYYIALYYTKTS